MALKFKRVFITGASGTGKTTLAKVLSKQLHIPFISTSAKEVWPEFGFKDHKSAHRHSCYDPRIGNQYQHAVLKKRISALQYKYAFISDRSPFDNYAYYLMQIGYLSGQFENKVFRKLCENNLYLGDVIIFLRYNKDTVLEDDGYRIVNTDYQMMVDSVIDISVNKLLKHTLPILELNSWDLEDKLEIIKDFING